MGDGVGGEVGDLHQRRGPGGDRGDEQAPGLQRPHHGLGHVERPGGVLEHLEGARHVVSAGVGLGMGVDVLAQHPGVGVGGSEGIQAHIVGVGRMTGEDALAAADVEHGLALAHPSGGLLELGPRSVRITTQPLVGPGVAVEGRIERAVALDHRIEEGHAAGRLPEADHAALAQQVAELHPAGVPPQLDQQPRGNVLDQPHGRAAGDRTGRRLRRGRGLLGHAVLRSSAGSPSRTPTSTRGRAPRTGRPS